MIKKIYWGELITAFYINSFVILKPILIKYNSFSSIILMLECFIMLFIFLINNKLQINKKNTFKAFTFISIITIWFLFDYLFRFNIKTYENYYYFLVFGGIPSIWFIKVKNFQILLKYWILFAILGGVFYITDPFARYITSGSYMQFGTCILPAFGACVCLFLYYKVKIILPLAMIFLVEIIIYANKGAIISAIGIVLFFFLSLSKSKKEIIKKIFTITIITLIIIIFFSQVLSIFISIVNNITREIGVGSYSMSDINIFLNGGQNLSSFEARINIWRNIWKELYNSYFIGIGIGTFEAKYGNYPHNFVLDILITHGVLFGSIIFILIIYFIKAIIQLKKDEFFIFSSLTMLLWVLPTIFSFTYWKVIYFWVFIIIGIYFLTNKK